MFIHITTRETRAHTHNIIYLSIFRVNSFSNLSLFSSRQNKMSQEFLPSLAVMSTRSSSHAPSTCLAYSSCLTLPASPFLSHPPCLSLPVSPCLPHPPTLSTSLLSLPFKQDHTNILKGISCQPDPIQPRYPWTHPVFLRVSFYYWHSSRDYHSVSTGTHLSHAYLC